MKPRVLLLAPIHNWPGYLTQCADEIDVTGRIQSPFPKWQAHESWYRALVQLGVDARVHIYSDSLLFNAGLRAKLGSRVLRQLGRWATHPRLRYLGDIQSEKPWDRPYRTTRLIKTFDHFSPDFVFISGGTILNTLGQTIWSTLRQRRPSARFVLFNGQSPATANAAEKALLPFVDAVITNDEAHAQVWRQLGARQSIALPFSAADPDLMESVRASDREKQTYRCDVAFIGQLKPIQYRDRLEILNTIADLDLGIWTDDPSALSDFPNLRSRYRGSLSGAEMLKAYQACKVGLNIHGEYMISGANLRTFEIPSMGCAQVVDHCLPGLFENGRDIVLFQDAGELRAGLNRLLKDAAFRQQIADNGQYTTRTRHTYAERFKTLFTRLGHPL